MRTQLGNQPRQLSLLIGPDFAKGGPGRQIESRRARPNQDEFESVGRRGEGCGPHSGRPLMARQRANDSDTQPLAGRRAADGYPPSRLRHRILRRDQGARADVISRHPPLHVVAGAEDAVRLHEQPAVVPAPGHNVARTRRRRAGDAGVAAGLVWLRAVLPRGLRHQIDARADAEIVVDRDVKGHAQQEDKAAYIHVVAEDVVDVGAADAAVSEQSGETDPSLKES